MVKTKNRYYVIAAFIWIVLILFGELKHDYNGYHAKMHCILTWGVVSEVNKYSGKSYHGTVSYAIDGRSYHFSTRPIHPRYLGDSVLVYYDSTRNDCAFLPCRNPKDIETAFYKSEEKIFCEKWHNNLEKYQHQLAVEQRAHKNREHFYDYFCWDDK